MSHRKSWGGLVVGIGIGLAAGLAVSVATARQSGIGGAAGSGNGAFTARGNFDVGIATETAGVTLPFNAPIRNVREVTLLDKWALIHYQGTGKMATVVLPRERVIYLNIVE